MTLATFLEQKGITVYRFAQMLGRKPSVVGRWCNGTIPRKKYMPKITKLTGGLVGPSDFYK